MSDRWPLLVSDPLQGEYLVSSQLRPRAGAVLISTLDYEGACDRVRDLCGTWGGGGHPLVPVGTEGFDLRWARILDESNIDGIEDSDLLSDEVRDEYTDREGPASAQLLRIVVDMDPKPVVQTIRGMSTEDPWHLSYLSVTGDLSSLADPQNAWNDLPRDLTFDSVLTIRGITKEGSASGLLALLRDFDTTTAVELSRAKLPTGLQGSYFKGFPSSSRFEWSDDATSQRFGPNIVVVYDPRSSSDLAMIWNLRARFLHPHRFPLAVPMTPTVEDDINVLLNEGAAHFFGFGHNLALTSMSVASDRLAEIATRVGFAAISPWDLLRPIGGYCSTSNDVVRFVDGKARIPSFSPSDLQAIGGSYLGRHQGTWMKRKSIVVDESLPPSRTMRRQTYHGERFYLEGPIATGGKPDGYTRVVLPSGLEVLSALAFDHGLRLTESAPGKAAEHLIRAAGQNLGMFAAPGVVNALSELTRGRSASIVKRRLNQFLKDSNIDESSDRYQVVLDRLNAGLGVPDSEEISYPTFDRLRQLLHMRRNAAERWVGWAMESGLILRGVEANCTRCGHKQWRPLSEVLPSLICHACGNEVASAHGFDKIGYRYRASEVLLRAMSADVLPHVLAMRFVCQELRGREFVFGGYPGVEFRNFDSETVDAEADVIVVLRNGGTVIGECKNHARGLSGDDLSKLWAAADQLNARATFAATLDRSADCGSEWLIAESPSGRPHFSLTAEHLLDVAGSSGGARGELFSWRSDYSPRLDQDGKAVVGGELLRRVDEDFSRFVERTATDLDRLDRAPWMRSSDD